MNVRNNIINTVLQKEQLNKKRRKYQDVDLMKEDTQQNI